MGIFFTRAAKIPKAVLLFTFITVASIFVLSTHAPIAHADGDIIPGTGVPAQSAFLVTLTGTSNASQYTVTATRASDNSKLNFHTDKLNINASFNYDSDYFVWGNSAQCVNASSPTSTYKQFGWNFTVTNKSGQTAATVSRNYCGKPDAGGDFVTVSIPVTDGAVSTPGTVSGQFAYVDRTSQQTLPFGSTTVATLTKDGSTTTLVFGSDGTFKSPNLAPGDYTLKAAYTAGADLTAVSYVMPDQKVTIKSGQDTRIELTLGADGKATQGVALTDTTACTADNQDSNGNCTAATDTIDCGGGVFNWLICPVITLVTKAGQVLDNFITSTLDIDVKYIFDGTGTKGTAPYGYYTAWNAFRVIATVLLVIAGLVMVASQALGFEILDAYTIRRTLPRLMVAIIGISLSWPLMRFAVQLFDTIGFDVRGLIYGPFQGFSAHYSLSTSILSVLGGTAAVLLLGPVSLTIILSLLITIFIGFLALVIRQVAIILLVILAPVAIACYVLPNTQRGWRLWHENFFGLLLAFPLISATIAAGHVFAIVAISSSTGSTGSITADAAGLITHFTMHGFTQTLADATNNVGSIVAQGTALVADNAPKAMVGWLMQKSIGAISTLAGGAGGLLGLGAVSKKLSAARGAAAGDRFKKMQNQSLWDNNSKIGKGMNKAASIFTDPLNNAAYYGRNTIPGLRKRGQKVAAHIEHMQSGQSGALFEELNKAGYNDKAFRALSGSHDGLSQAVKDRMTANGLTIGQAPKSLSQLEGMADALSAGGDTEKLAANAIHGSMGRLATLYQDPEMSKASIQAAGIMGLAAHGFASTDDLATVGNSLQKEGGAGFAQSVITQSQLMGARSRPDTKAGYGVMYDKGKFISGIDKDKGGNRDLALLSSLNGHDVAGAKGGFLNDARIQSAYQEVLETSQQDKSYAEAAQQWNSLSSAQRSDLKQTDAGKVIERKATAHNIHQAVKDQLYSWAGPYSQASADIKAGAAQMIGQYGLKADFDSHQRQERSPETRGENGPQPPDAGGGAGGPA